MFDFLIIREIHIKTTMRYHYIPIRIDKIKKKIVTTLNANDMRINRNIHIMPVGL